MKKLLIIAVAAVLVLGGCSDSPLPQVEKFVQTEYKPGLRDGEQNEYEQKDASYDYLTFEEAVSEFATDVVIVRYVGHEPFGERQSLIEYEFIVVERILGNAADRIFVYAENPENINASVDGIDRAVLYKPGDLSFDADTEYMLALRKIENPLSHTHEDGFTFICNIVIDMDNPGESMMYSEELSLHSDELEFTDELSEDDIIAFIEELTEDNTPGREFVQSDTTRVLISDSPYVFVVEVGELLVSPRTDWMSTDIYHVSAVQVLKGDVADGHEFLLTFAADTVKEGGRYIVAVEPIEEGYDDWFRLTSINSLFNFRRLSEILEFIGN
ncbi:MAG: hypothetical protein FWH07_04170 [Oscillospiraceae bacterium]|nr:hypothetical protein [Oscillospiraceae bacterium]